MNWWCVDRGKIEEVKYTRKPSIREQKSPVLPQADWECNKTVEQSLKRVVVRIEETISKTAYFGILGWRLAQELGLGAAVFSE